MSDSHEDDGEHLKATCDGCRTVTCGPVALTKQRVQDHERTGCGPIRTETVYHSQKAYGNH